MYRTRTLSATLDGTRTGFCPTCRAAISATAQGATLTQCVHLRRTWRVAADGRVRAEFTREAEATATV